MKIREVSGWRVTYKNNVVVAELPDKRYYMTHVAGFRGLFPVLGTPFSADTSAQGAAHADALLSSVSAIEQRLASVGAENVVRSGNGTEDLEIELRDYGYYLLWTASVNDNQVEVKIYINLAWGPTNENKPLSGSAFKVSMLVGDKIIRRHIAPNKPRKGFNFFLKSGMALDKLVAKYVGEIDKAAAAARLDDPLAARAAFKASDPEGYRKKYNPRG